MSCTFFWTRRLTGPLLLTLCSSRERDSYEAASKAAHAQLQILEQAESGATERMQDLVAEVERLQQAYTDCQTKLEQQRGQLGGMAAETRQRALDQRLAAAALSQQSAALSKAEQELEVARAQLAALQACEGAKENKLRRCMCRPRGGSMDL